MMWRCVVWYKFTDVSEERTGSIFGVEQYAKQAESSLYFNS
jgi:hypothetical protein